MRSASIVSPSFLVSDSSGGSGGGGVTGSVRNEGGGGSGGRGVKPPKCAKDPGIYAF